jgi:hypothetical protein
MSKKEKDKRLKTVKEGKGEEIKHTQRKIDNERRS